MANRAERRRAQRKYNKTKEVRKKLNIMNQYQIDELDRLGVKVRKDQPIPGALIISVPKLSEDGSMTGDEIAKKTEEVLNRIRTSRGTGTVKIIHQIRESEEGK